MLSLHSFLKHIADEVSYVLRHTEGLEKEVFLADETLTRAVVRSLEIIGEATKKLPDDFRASHPEVEWRKMAGIRDMLIHHYFGIEWEVVWDVITNKLPELDSQITAILEQEEESGNTPQG